MKILKFCLGFMFPPAVWYVFYLLFTAPKEVQVHIMMGTLAAVILFFCVICGMLFSL